MTEVTSSVFKASVTILALYPIVNSISNSSIFFKKAHCAGKTNIMLALEEQQFCYQRHVKEHAQILIVFLQNVWNYRGCLRACD